MAGAPPIVKREELRESQGHDYLTTTSGDKYRAESETSPESGSASFGDPKDGPTVVVAQVTAEEKPEDFALDDFLKQGYFERRIDGQSAKRIGVVYKNLTVKGPGSATTFIKTLPEAIVGSLGPDLYRLLCCFVPSLNFTAGSVTRDLIHDFTGLIRDGEMLLVLGRPGAGCSTFLKAIANERAGYAEVTGDVTYGCMTAQEQGKSFIGEVNYIPEDDIHLPELNVWQTLTFALMNKTKKRNGGDIPIIGNALLRLFGISHTKFTNVGNELVPGVSGGERKRVSIAEGLATKSSVLCLDNSTRGLDASTALEYARSLRTIADVSKKAIALTLYQAGEGIYEQMDKVLVIDTGRCIFLGPAEEAKQYFVDLGFYCDPAQTTADFLTACTHPIERRYRKGCAEKTPKTPEELEAAFKSSQSYKNVLHDIQIYEREIELSNFETMKEFRKSVERVKSHRTVSQRSSYTVSYLRQVTACLKREFWLLMGDSKALYTKAFVITAVAFVLGSLFYGESLNSSGAFSRGGAVFMSVLFLCWLQQAELMKLVIGRDVIARHHGYALYRPSAVSVARIILDVIVLVPQVLLWNIIMYFICNLDRDASKFWIQTLFIYTTLLTITALYRMFASFSATINDAVRFSGIALNVLILYAGYVIPKTQLTTRYVWFGWINYLNPLGYAFQAVAINEFSDRNIDCDPLQLIPQQIQGSPLVNPAHQACSLTGSSVDTTSVPGSFYLQSSFSFRPSKLWRNLGVLIAFMVLYILATALANEIFSFAKVGGGPQVVVRNERSKKALIELTQPSADLEKGSRGSESSLPGRQMENKDVAKEKALSQISGSRQVFTWENVNYSVPVPGGGKKRLLNGIDGYCKPGVLVALMGVSGAGKTTLLNTLSQRAPGIVSGDILVDGRPPGSAFQRSTGFCEQMDLHDGTATIREAFEFSALLRQDKDIPRAEKIAYVDTVIDLLELYEAQDTVINCLSLEQRKRLTIGVELSARPSLLLFLDEPTSGLDSQSAYAIVLTLKRLASAGQAILCTIHQPSSVLIQQFDLILALNPGGNPFYFGPVGEGGQDLATYFAERGFECPPQKNIAEHILEVTTDTLRADGTAVDWVEEWRRSDNAKALKHEIHNLNASRMQIINDPNKTQHNEFAASTLVQTSELTKRLFRQYWREPSYLYGKLFTAVIMGILNGFTFFQLGNSAVDMQNRMFSTFMIITIPAIILNSVIPKFFQNLLLWMVREHPSRIYGWFAFTTAQVLGEIPMAILSGTVYWLLWYWPAFGTDQGHATESSAAGYSFLMTVLFWLFAASWGQWITAFAPSFTVVANTVPLFSIMFSMFNGVLRPYSSLPPFWRYTMYYANPSQWWISGILASVMPDVPVYCSAEEMIRFTPPPGLTCGQYAGAFAATAGGNLTDPAAVDLCRYCPLRTGDQYLEMLSIRPGDKWRNLGVFCAFVVSNYLLVYFFIWTVRIKGWRFGMGYLFGFLGLMADVIVFNPIRKLTVAIRRR